MNPIVVMIADVITKEPPQVVFMDCDHMIEKLTAATADPAFRDPVGMSLQMRRMATLRIDVSE